MKKKLNIYCLLMISVCMFMLVYNIGDRLMECYNLGKGMYRNVPDSGSWIAKIITWGFDMQVLFIAGIIFVLIIRNINKAIVFDWRNIRLFRVLSVIIFIHFILSTTIIWIDKYLFQAEGVVHYELYTQNVIDYAALIATLFILIIAEVFAIGMRMREEQELTI